MTPFLGMGLVAGRRRAAAFSPMDYGPAVWYDSSVASSIRDAGGAAADIGEAVATWQDQSGNGRHIGQTLDAADRPLYQSDGISFDGTDDYLTTFGQATTNVINSTATTVYMAVRFDTLAHLDNLWNGGGGSTPYCRLVEYSAGAYRPVGAGDKPASGNQVLAAQFYIVTVRTNTNFVGITLDDGTEVSDTSVLTPTATRLQLGGNGGVPAGLCLDCTIKEVIGYPALHDATQRAKVIAYLMAKNLTVLLVASVSMMVNGVELGIFGL